MSYVEDQNSIATECAEKRDRLVTLMRDQRLDAIVISRHENIAWFTAGQVDIRVGLLRETGPASLLVTKEGESFCITTTNEAARLAHEEFAALPCKPLLRPWTSTDVESSIRSVISQGRVGTDIPLGEHAVINLQPLRLLLTSGELNRYRWLGRQIAESVTEIVLSLRPGRSERSIQAAVASDLISRGLLPSVHLEAVDQRILAYPHPVPRTGVLERFAMVGLCARYGGLAASVTRFVHFGPLPNQLARDFTIVAQVNARVQAATRTGTTANELFTVLQNAYTEAGAPGGEQGHHQGGAAGYLEREWFARPGGTEKVTAAQALAWNPNLRGAKVEDTRLLFNNQLETITRTPALPEVTTVFNGVEYTTADVLIR
jgi:antitoxin VapB